MIALVDCNNFFVSCERVFEPGLRDRPVAVLSSNDGCIIARSNDIKPYIPMGAPLFQVRGVIRRHGVVLKSSNFALYSDMSRRVMAVLERFASEMEVYSIDEAFLQWPKASDAYALREAVLRELGIPVSIGIASTRTLSKAAAKLAKYRGGIMDWSRAEKNEIDAWLQEVLLEDVWGVARRLSKKFHAHRMHTAYDLKTMPERSLRTHNVTVRRLVYELRGCPADSTPTAPSQSMVSSRSFGTAVCSKLELAQALSTHAAHLGRKLRREGLYAGSVTAFISVGQGGRAMSGARTLTIPMQGSYELIKVVQEILEGCYHPSVYYKKAGVMVNKLTSAQQLTLDSEESEFTRAQAINQTMDTINARWGAGTVQLAAEGIEPRWRPRHALRSPRYTSEWNELKIAR